MTPFSDSLSLRLHPFMRFNLALHNNSLDRSTKSTRSHFKLLSLLVNIRFQILFHSPPGVLFTFPSRYYRATLDTSLWVWFLLTGLSPSMVCFPKTFLLISLNQLWGPNPWCIAAPGLGSFSFARHYLRNRFFFLFLWVLRCFSSPRSPLTYYFTHMWIYRLFSLYEFPHSDIPGYNGYVLLPEAFRSLSRPSSAIGA